MVRTSVGQYKALIKIHCLLASRFMKAKYSTKCLSLKNAEFLEIIIGAQLVKESSATRATQKFIAVFAMACRWFLPDSDES